MSAAAGRRMKFSVVCSQDTAAAEAVELWQTCEDAGPDMIGVVDLPTIFRELYV